MKVEIHTGLGKLPKTNPIFVTPTNIRDMMTLERLFGKEAMNFFKKHKIANNLENGVILIAPIPEIKVVKI